MPKVLLLLALSCALNNLFGQQIPVWKHQYVYHDPRVLLLDQYDNTYILADAFPGRFLKLSPTGQQIWSKNLSFNGLELWPLAALMDTIAGKILVAGILLNPSDNQLAVAEMDLVSGNLLQFTVDSTYWAQPFYIFGEPKLEISKDNAGNVYLMGTAGLEPTTQPTTVTLKFNAQLEKIASYFPNAPYIPTSIGLASTTGHVFYNGGFYEPLESTYKHYIEKASVGQITTILWRHFIPDWQYLTALNQLPNSDLLLLINETLPNGLHRSLVSRVKDLGNSAETLWATEIPIVDAEFYNLIYDETRDKVYAAGSYILGEMVDINQMFTGFGCLNGTTGELIWSYKTTEGGRHRLSKIHTDTQGRLWTVGSINPEFASTDYWVGYFSEDTTLIDYLSYQGNCPDENETAFDIAFRSDKKLIVTGSACESLSSANWITTLLYDSLSAIVSTSLPTPKSKFSIAPNPVKNTLLIQFMEGEGFDYQIFNPWGRVQKSGQCSASTAIINTEHFPVGFYLLQIRSDDGVAQVFKVLVTR